MNIYLHGLIEKYFHTNFNIDKILQLMIIDYTWFIL